MIRFEQRSVSIPEDTIARIAKQTGVSRMLAGLLVNRGLTDSAAVDSFLNPNIAQLYDPMLLPDIDKAILRIGRAVESKEPVCIYGDYDADGICATAMLMRFLVSKEANVIYHIPSRHSEGYGMNAKTVRELYKSGIKLIITVDNGIGSMKEIDECAELGMDVIVTDHHQCKDEIPRCVAVIDHNRQDSRYPEKYLCGAGIVLKLIQAMDGRESLKPYILPAGIATIADVVPLLGENRILASLALNALNDGACSPGLKALLESLKTRKREYDARDVSFGIAPRLNASGRMEDASIAVELLLTNDNKRIAQIVGKLNMLNAQRQSEEADIIAEAEEMIGRERISSLRCIILSSRNWNPGILGIAASRLAERYNRPVILFSETEGILTGSGRTAADLNLYELLTRFEEYFIKYGGHAGAAGITMDNDNLEPFRRSINEYLKTEYPAGRFIPVLKYELNAKLREITEDFIKDLERLAPFGEGNPVPLIVTEPAELESIRLVGGKGEHLKASVRQDDHAVDLIAFGRGDRAFDYSAMSRVKIAFTPAIDEWNNQKNVQLHLKAIERLEIEDPAEYIRKHEQKFYDAISRNILYNDMRGTLKVNAVDSDAAFKLFMNADIAGTLVLCFTPGGAERLLKSAESPGADIRFFTHDDDPCAYNSVVFAPVIDKMKPSRYDRILVYDCCFSTGMICELSKHADVFVSNEVPDGLSITEKFSVGREELKDHYSALDALACTRMRIKEDVLKLIEQKTGTPPHKSRLAMAIFEELGFIKKDIGSGWSLDKKSSRRSLDESKCYRIANSLPMMLKEYSLSIKGQEDRYGSKI
ncbi:MAG: Single-stranded-DNA-specific exonuclease RecJ [Firmicutes bacterium ADurb.Bin182]|nr:MAG: Single-stranded-DNA-specific exonuclease RecJ [Firmicutes bacterium ADurb.Bin182]